MTYIQKIFACVAVIAATLLFDLEPISISNNTLYSHCHPGQRAQASVIRDPAQPRQGLPNKKAEHVCLWIPTFVGMTAFGKGPNPQNADETPLNVFAAASLADVIGEISELHYAQTGIPVQPVFASSSALARQIEAGAPADIFISANHKWMQALELRGLVDPDSTRSVTGNQLVLIAPIDARPEVAGGTHIRAALSKSIGLLVLGEPETVPVGIYGAQALKALGLYDALLPKMLFASDARAVLAWVERGEADLGLVYQTDAKTSTRIKQVSKIADALHDPIVYPAGLVGGSQHPHGSAFLDFLLSDQAQNVFSAYGFYPPRETLDRSEQTP